MYDSNSILESTKNVLGLDADYDVFDGQIVMHINTVFSTLNQLGIGPTEGFEIQGSTETWDTFLLGNVKFNSVKTYVYTAVRLVFDPPATSFAIAAMEKQKEELEWRLNVLRESNAWIVNAIGAGQISDIDGGNAYGA